jgi:ComF family protein
MLPQAFESILSLLFPTACGSCGRIVARARDGAACAECWLETRFFDRDRTACRKCSAPLFDIKSDIRPNCHRCDDHHYDIARASGFYEKALAASVISLKSEPNVGARLREMLCEAFENAPFGNADLLIPVPLSRKRLLERGFNQAEILGQIIARRYGIPIDDRSLIRRRHTGIHRIAMDSRARELTVESAFAVVRPNLISGRNILLIDDVLTSGATSSACAKELKKKGARDVFVLTAARAV